MTTLKTTKSLVSRFVKPILIYQKKTIKNIHSPTLAGTRRAPCSAAPRTVPRCCARGSAPTWTPAPRSSGPASVHGGSLTGTCSSGTWITWPASARTRPMWPRWDTKRRWMFIFLTSCKIIWQVFLEFEAMFDHHLKTMISDPEEVDNILKKVRTLCLDFRSFEARSVKNLIDFFQKVVNM